MNRLKLAELTSGVGALVLGIGVGSLFPEWFGGAAAMITIVGLLLHAFGMWDKHRLENSQAGTNPSRRVAQRAVFHIQRELESIGDSHNATIVLCDRGTVDGLAYWPGAAGELS